jgi:hypothetical protein
MIKEAKDIVSKAERVVDLHDKKCLSAVPGDSKAIELLRDSYEELRRAIWAAEDAKT